MVVFATVRHPCALGIFCAAICRVLAAAARPRALGKAQTRPMARIDQKLAQLKFIEPLKNE